MRRRLVSFCCSIVGVIACATAVGCAYLSAQPVPRTPVANSERTQPQDQWLYDFLLLEIAPITSCSPDKTAINRFLDAIAENHICRRQSILVMNHPEIEMPAAFPRGPGMHGIAPMWMPGMIETYERDHRVIHDSDPTDRVGFIFVAYIEGRMLHGDRGITQLGGVQYSDSSFAIFKDGAANRESAVLLHELSHLIGIHKKTERAPKYHCWRTYCVLYPSTGSPFARLCSECRRILKEIINAKSN